MDALSEKKQRNIMMAIVTEKTRSMIVLTSSVDSASLYSRVGLMPVAYFKANPILSINSVSSLSFTLIASLSYPVSPIVV